MASPIGFIVPGQGPPPPSSGFNPTAPSVCPVPPSTQHFHHQVDLRTLLSGTSPATHHSPEVNLRLSFADAAVLQTLPASVHLPGVRILRVSLDAHWVKCKAVAGTGAYKDKTKKHADKSHKSKLEKAAKKKKDKLHGQASPLHGVWMCLGRVLFNVQMVVAQLDCGCKLSPLVEMAGCVFPHLRHIVIDDWRSDMAGKSKDCYDEDDFVNARGLQSLTVQHRNVLHKEKRLDNLFDSVEKLPMLRSVNLVLATSSTGQHGLPALQPQFGHQNQAYPQPQFGLPPNQGNLQPRFGHPHQQNPLQPQFGLPNQGNSQPQFGLPNQGNLQPRFGHQQNPLQPQFGLPNPHGSLHSEHLQKLLHKSKLGQRVRIQTLNPQTFKADLEYLNSLEQGQFGGHNIPPQLY